MGCASSVPGNARVAPAKEAVPARLQSTEVCMFGCSTDTLNQQYRKRKKGTQRTMKYDPPAIAILLGYVTRGGLEPASSAAAVSLTALEAALLSEDALDFTLECSQALDAVLYMVGRHNLLRLFGTAVQQQAPPDDSAVDTMLLRHLLAALEREPRRACRMLVEHRYALCDLCTVIAYAQPRAVAGLAADILRELLGAPSTAQPSPASAKETSVEDAVVAALKSVCLVDALHVIVDGSCSSSASGTAETATKTTAAAPTTSSTVCRKILTVLESKTPHFPVALLSRFIESAGADQAMLAADWQCTACDTWPDNMPRLSKGSQRATLKACYTAQTKVKRLQEKLANAKSKLRPRDPAKDGLAVGAAPGSNNAAAPTVSSADEQCTQIVAKIKELHRGVAAKVNGATDAVFHVLTERQLFEETRQFSRQAEKMPACSSTVFDPMDVQVPSVGTDWLAGASEWHSTLDGNIKDFEEFKTIFTREQILPKHIFQAGRNAWTCFALQVIYGSCAAQCSPAVFGYSMLYPYTDNFLDDPTVSLAAKMQFQAKFGRRLLGVHNENDSPIFKSGLAAFDMVSLIETQHDRTLVPEVYLSLAAINDAQTVRGDGHVHGELIHSDGGSDGRAAKSKLYEELLEQTCYKGGTSVLADAHMVNGRIPTAQSAFAFALGYALQMVDDLQDSVEDGAEGQNTLLTLVDPENPNDVAYAEATAIRLATFLEFVCKSAGGANDGQQGGDSDATTTTETDPDANADAGLRRLILTMTWNMVLKAVARNQGLFSTKFLKECGTLGPLPPEKMEHLQSLKGLHRLALADLI
eukprot:gene17356-23696_t